MTDHLNEEEAQLLKVSVTYAHPVCACSYASPTKSALSTAFSPVDITHKPITVQDVVHDTVPQPPASNSTEPPPESTPASSSDSPVAEEQWRVEYEEHVTEWRQRSAEQRRQAEEQRARWEAIRQLEREEAVAGRRDMEGSFNETDSGWESVNGTAVLGASLSAAGSSSPSPADTRDLVAGEGQKHTQDHTEVRIQISVPFS